MKSSPNTVFLDAGKTLIQACPSVSEIYSLTSAEYGLPVEPARMKKAFGMEWERSTMVRDLGSRGRMLTQPEEKAWWKGFVRRVIDRFGQVDEFDPFFEDLYDRFARVDGWRLFPDVINALRQLKDDEIRLAVVSNWDSRLNGLLRGLGIDGFFDAVVISSQVGYEKPDPMIYRVAMERMNVNAIEVIHVGDNPRLDVEGAAEAGIEAILLDRQDGCPGYVPRIRELSELIPLIRG